MPSPDPTVPSATGTPALVWRERLLMLAILAAVLCAYLPAWHGGFIWDDDGHVTKPELRSLHGLWRIWFDLHATQQYYPFLHSAFWVEHRLFGDNPFGYHLVNIVLHGCNAILLGLILRKLRIPGAWLAAGIFALHPVMVESVAWITELKNTLSGLFYFSSALAYLHFDENRSKRWYSLALGLFVLGLLSKTVIATLVGALLVVFWWQRGKLEWKRNILPLLPFFALGAAGGIFTAWVEHSLIGAQGADFAFTPIARVLIAGRVVWFYFGKLLWPADLMFVYPRWTISQTAVWPYLFPVAALLVVGWLWSLRGRARGPLAAALLFIGTLFPVLGFFNVYPFVFSLVADHFQYLASTGVIVAVSAGATLLLGSRPVARGLALALLAVLGVLTWRQCRMYRDSETVYRTNLAQNPDSWLSHYNLGLMLLPDHPEQAIAHFQAAVRLQPDYVEAQDSLGSALLAAGQAEEAVGHYEAALRLRPNYVEAHSNLATALVQIGQAAEAIDHYETVLHFRPNDAVAHFNLGNALIRAHRREEAIDQFEAALELKPDYAEAHNNLATALVQSGRLPEAVDHYQEALRLQPADPETHANLGAVMLYEGKVDEARAQYQEALRLQPGFPPAERGLARIESLQSVGH